MVALFDCVGMWYDVVGLEFLRDVLCFEEDGLVLVFIGRLLCVYFLGMMRREVGADGHTYTPADYTLEDGRCFWHAYPPRLLVQTQSLLSIP